MRYLSSLKNKKLSNKTCLLRVDFNLTDAELSEKNLRITAVLPTIKFLIGRGAKVVILSHRGRPVPLKRGISNSPAYAEPACRTGRASAGRQFLISKNFTLKPFTKILSSLLKKPVHFIDFDKKVNFIKIEDAQKIRASVNGSIFLLENLRLLKGEKENSTALAKKLASLGDLYINDAFSVSHRKNASVVAITKFLPSYAGLCLENEIKNLSKAMRNPKKPLIIILGGAKISDKIGVIKNFSRRADKFLIGGAVANTFFAAKKIPIGSSLYEKEMVPLAKRLLRSSKVILPIDWLSEKGKILDIGPETSRNYAEFIKNAKTIIWNGPMGYFEDEKFKKGSEVVLEAIVKSHAFSIIGGGETISSISNPPAGRAGFQFPIPKKNIFLSTGGGAMLEYLSGKKLPGIKALK